MLLAACGLLFAATSACADFYKFTGEDGVETFTNTPTSTGGVRILREAKPMPAAKKPTKTPAKVMAKVAETRDIAREPMAEPPSSGREPFLPVKGVVTSHCGWRHDPIDGVIRHHNGVDIAVPTGTRVKAIAAGKVIESGWHGGYGNLVVIDHGDGSHSMYGHNSQLDVRAGDQVASGQTVALSGSTGRSTGPHLHFELWRNGANVTEAYLSNGAGMPEVAGGIRTYLHKDGSIVFTNLN